MDKLSLEDCVKIARKVEHWKNPPPLIEPKIFDRWTFRDIFEGYLGELTVRVVRTQKGKGLSFWSTNTVCELFVLHGTCELGNYSWPDNRLGATSIWELYEHLFHRYYSRDKKEKSREKLLGYARALVESEATFST